MNRREALTRTAALMGTAIIGGQAFLSGCRQRNTTIESFDEEVVELLNDIGETILPETSSSPGARAADIGQFMKLIVTDCYSPEEQSIFFKGINTIQQTAQEKYSNAFNKLTTQQKIDLMLSFDEEARQATTGEEHFFNMLNQLTVWGFFSSEPGSTQALRYVPVPGRYEGCVPYKDGEGAWVY